MAGIVHFSNYFRYMERAEHAFWRSLDLSVISNHKGDSFTWPRVQAACDYKAPFRFEDKIEVEISVQEVKSKAVTFRFRFRHEGAAEFTAQGTITAVCAAHDEAAGRMRAREIPADIRELLESRVIA